MTLANRLSILAAAACLLSVSALSATPAGAAESLFDGVAAQVGGGIVLVSEVNQMSAPIEERMRTAGAPDAEIAMLRVEILDRLIEARLIEDVVKRLELSASEREVDGAIASIASDTGLTLEQLQASVTGHGLTVEEYRDKIRAEIERSKVLNTMVRTRVRVEDEEIEALYTQRFGQQPVGGEEVHVRHILVAFQGQEARDPDTACGLVEDVAAQISAGTIDFETVARDISDANPGRGGDLGWIHSGELAGWMAAVIDAMEPGDLSGSVRTSFGCNLLQLVERRKFEPMTFDRARPALERAIFRQKMEAEYSKWVDTLREQTYIERKGVFRSGGESASR